jgi:hypothetical protein
MQQTFGGCLINTLDRHPKRGFGRSGIVTRSGDA